MFITGSNRRKFLACIATLSSFAACVAASATRAPEDSAQLFARADYIKMIDNGSFVKLLERLENKAATLSIEEKWHLRYLEAWQATYIGQVDKAKPMLEAVVTQAPDINLREQAKSTLINLLGVSHRYEEAFSYLDQTLDELPRVTDAGTRLHALAEAAQLLVEAGQYDLAAYYADQLVLAGDKGNYKCIGLVIKLDAKFRQAQERSALLPQLQHGLDECVSAGNVLAADTVRRDMASLALQRGKINEAIGILRDHYAEVQDLHYQDLTSEYTAMLADAYWKQGNISQAEKYALSTVDMAAKSSFTEPLVMAYHLLYQISRQQGNLREALSYHEKYMAADNGHLDDVREKALAYQVIKQQVDAKKAELDELNKQNQILHLQQALDHKAVETSRLYIALLLTVLASIGLWLYRLKRSQLRFMRLARRDGLTGILNRQHFVEEADQSLRYVAKSLRGACLILIDLDHFKNINDTHGHFAGDQALKRAVSVCQQHLHSCDVFGRIGGEEFGILLPECTLIQALERAEHIRLAIQVPSDDEGEHIVLTASFGVASTAHYGYDLRRLLVAADSALYRAKRDGRNRVVVSMDDHAAHAANGTAQHGGGKLSDAHPYAKSTD